MPSGMISAARACAAVHQALDVGHRRGRGDDVEVGRVGERGDQFAAVGGVLAIHHGEAHVADVPVQRVAVQQQEERRHEQQDQQRPRDRGQSARIPSGRRRAPSSCARPPPRASDDVHEDVFERRLHELERLGRAGPVRPGARRSGAVSRSPGLSQHVQRRAEEARLLDRREVVERAQRLHRRRACAPRPPPGRRTPASARPPCPAPRSGPRASAPGDGSAPPRRGSAS